MLQDRDFLSILIDSFRSAFASPVLRDLLFWAFTVSVFIMCIRCISRFIRIACYPSRFEHRKQVDKADKADKADKEPSCVFRCDCEDCNSYESGKYCSRCDRFQICAYCSAREHCDL